MSQPFDYKGENFKVFLDGFQKSDPITGKKKKITKVEAAKMMGVSRDTLYQYFESKNISKEVRNKIYEVFNITENDLWGEDDNVRPVQYTRRDNMFYVPLKAYGGFLSGYENEVYLSQLERGAMPMVKGECYAFEVEGFSMTPEFNPHDFAITTPVESFTDLVKGRVYVFQTIDGLILKCFDRIEGDNVYLYSLNEEYNPVKPIHKKDIKVVYQKEFKLTKN